MRQTTLDFEGNASTHPTGTAPKTYTGIYAMHKYWSKKPFNLVAEYIEHHSKVGDVVLDCFSGSGVSIIEAIRLGRKAIGIDINPAAVFMTDAALRPVDIKSLKKAFANIKSACAPLISKLYATRCSRCGSDDAVATHVIWENGRATELWFDCSACGTKKGIKQPDEHDVQLAGNPSVKPSWHPNDVLHTNGRINVKEGTRISDLFTKRALVALSIIFEKINKIESEPERTVLLSTFTATLPQASKMVFVIRRRGKTAGSEAAGRAEVGSWVIGFWVPKEHFEIDAWRCFENRFARTLRGKAEMASLLDRKIQLGDLPDAVLNGAADYYVGIGNASELPLPDRSIDYAFIDPPHGNRIPYLELSMIWNSWLRKGADWENEIIVSEARERNKTLLDYNARMIAVFQELSRVLKNDANLSVAFNSLDDDTWVSFVGGLTDAGFKIKMLKPLAYSANSVVQDNRENALKTDFVMTCVREARVSSPSRLEVVKNSETIDCLVDDALRERDGGAEMYELLNHVLVTCIPQGKIVLPSAVLSAVYRKGESRSSRWLPKGA